MNDHPPASPPWWYWTIAGLALIWASLGILQVVPMLNADMPEPWWADTGYAVGQIGTFAGVIALLSRIKFARWFFVIAGFGFLTHRAWLFLLSGLIPTLPPFAPYTLFIAVLVDALLYWFSTASLRRNWLRPRVPE